MKESRIENNKSFYGCFYLGSFDSGQSITVANALRRSLLSDCTGLAIISVKIDTVQHEYSTLPGVRDSVLDILLNFKEIVLKKVKNPFGGHNGYKNKGLSSVYDKIGLTFFKPVVGYLKVKGPGIIRAKDLRLPPFIQCVDPNQYIATLAEDGVLNVKFVIMEGKSYYVQKLSSKSNSSISGRYNTKIKSIARSAIRADETRESARSLDSSSGAPRSASAKNLSNVSSDVYQSTHELGDASNYWTITKKRQNLLKQLKEIMDTQNNNTLSSKTEIKSKDEKRTEFTTPPDTKTSNISVPSDFRQSSQFNSTFLEKNTNTEPFNENSKQLNIDAVFSPVTKVNYIIEGYDNYIVESFNEKYKLIENLNSFLDSAKFLETNFPYFNKKWKIEQDEKTSSDSNIEKNEEFSNKSMSKKLLDYVTNLSTSDLAILCTPEGYSHYKGIGIPSSFTESSIPSKLNIESFGGPFASGVNVSSKQVVLLEIWTNGSLHPRDALLMAFKSLSYTFSPEKIKMTNPIFSNSASYKKIIENL
uniref:Plastid-encoded RNA polymerase subunit alpha n=1 Tax=Dunaliella salina TaxID=3046 RepID=A0A1C8XRM9_DUNSA|nr:alpha subunit of RNA polymerase [Dunaliella salina]